MWFSIIILILLISVSIFFFIYNKKIVGQIQKAMISSPVSLETKKQDMDIVYYYINRSFLKTLREFTLKDFQFSQNSALKVLYANHYCDTIRALLRPEILMSYEDENGETIEKSFFEYFIQKVYLLYIAETPDNIKNLLFKYYSGYNINNYFLDKKNKPKPSAINFINEYVRNKLWIRYSELESDTHIILNDAVASSENGYDINIDNLMNDYDALKLRALNLNIHHMTDDSDEWDRFIHPLNVSSNNRVSDKSTSVSTQNISSNDVFKVDEKTLKPINSGEK